ncbi:GGDEF domain-containing protein [Aquincola tertiaricarbonis]|uniref:diguanylate cyclase n=1 Tax=Aquincola tertiaricarbonis TaxID=391953 RepID=A0ABY4S8W9_AQUTE|nr:GGDEF domain-containing protein [Aquincola tertiaricarbonis]URI07521.1 GGDEF domain-containing protein [Aquincola tertiaricarbonis]
MSNNEGSRQQGEVSGAFLIGMLQSFGATHILPPEQIPFPVEGLCAESWYPYDYLVKLNQLIEDQVPHSASILFWAGVRFIELWHRQGPGKHMVRSGLDWVYCNDRGGGYHSVVRGDNIGWCRNRLTDEAQGVAWIENVMPLSPAYLRGIFFGGFYLFDDMAYFNTEVESVTHDAALPFQCTVIKLIFKKANPAIPPARLAQLRSVGDVAGTLSAPEAEELLWRYRHQLNLSSLLSDYNENIADLTGRAFSSLHAITDQLAAANLQLASEATTDPLTGLHNKRYFDREILAKLNFARREQHAVCAMMIDIDHFKRFNDHYGHLAGDAAIKSVADCLSSTIARGSDLIARFGGEEFVVILVNIDTAGVHRVARRIAAAIAALRIPHEKSGCCAFLTISVGSAMAQGNSDVQALLQRADDALYRAKAQGRNRHVHAA